jgi:hypothetical protein
MMACLPLLVSEAELHKHSNDWRNESKWLVAKVQMLEEGGDAEAGAEKMTED